MSQFLKMRVGTRIILIILFVCAVTVAIGTYGLTGTNSMNKHINDIIDNSLLPTRQLGEAKAYLQRYRVSVYNHILANDKKDLDEF